MNAPAKALPKPGSFGAWMLAIRPKTLSAGVMPVIVGAAYVQAEIAAVTGMSWFGWHPVNREAWSRLLGALVVALGIQIGTNLVNDVADHLKGADTPERLGPPRMTSLGLLSARTVTIGAVVSFTFATVAGVWLLYTLPSGLIPSWWVFAIGLASLVSGVLYTVGGVSIAYLGLGEIFVLGFFGIFATAGTTLVLTGYWSHDAVIAGVALGLLAVGLLEANNIRDIPTDAPIGKNTLAVRLGERRARAMYVVILAAPFVVDLFAVRLPYAFLPLLATPIAWGAVAPVVRGAEGRDLIKVLQRNSLLEVVFGLLLASAVVAASPATGWIMIR